MADKISKQVSQNLDETQNSKLDLILQNIDRISLEIKTLETRLTHKELKDRTEYGQLKYQLTALQDELRPIKRKKIEREAH